MGEGRELIKRSGKNPPRLSIGLDRYDVLSLWAFLALSHNKLDLLAFSQGLEAGSFNSAEVSEDVRTGFLRDESITF